MSELSNFQNKPTQTPYPTQTIRGVLVIRWSPRIRTGTKIFSTQTGMAWSGKSKGENVRVWKLVSENQTILKLNLTTGGKYAILKPLTTKLF